MNAIQSALARIFEGADLDRDRMRAAFGQIMRGEASDAQIGALLAALHVKGETVTEIAAAAELMRELAAPVETPDRDRLLDVCGTGGDRANTFNVSTTSALVAAAAGARIAKHGNRAVSSASGSADVLALAGVNLDLSPEGISACIDRIGIGFLFAPRHHGAMRHAASVRRELGVRTLFNLLGPLANPAGARRQVVGVFAPQWQQPLAEVLGQLGALHVLVAHSEDGLDELSVSAPSRIAEYKDGACRFWDVRPEDLGLKPAPLESIRAATAEESLATLRSVLAGETGPQRDIVLLNAGAALYAAGLADDLPDGLRQAGAAVDDGRARAKLDELVQLSNELD